MRQGMFITILLVAALVVARVIFMFLPEYIQKGGPLVVVLIALSLMLVTFIIERQRKGPDRHLPEEGP
jgi:membrane protein implicated in regulation of membrane protease activity